jgi:hypothetical protein
VLTARYDEKRKREEEAKKPVSEEGEKKKIKIRSRNN